VTITVDVQKLEPGNEIRLYELDLSAFGGSVLRFHEYLQSGPIVWQGLTYNPWPISAQDFSTTSDQQPTPKINVGNVDGSISLLCKQYADCAGAVVRIHQTFLKYLDGQPGADPTQEFGVDVWFIDRKASEDSETIQFELTNGINFLNRQLPGRDILGDTCAWITIGGYRGAECGYTGGAVADLNDNPTSNIALDNCSGTVAGCQFRFGVNGPLSFGSFAAAGLTRT
jgi:lambda family phage minor tail protein L